MSSDSFGSSMFCNGRLSLEMLTNGLKLMIIKDGGQNPQCMNATLCKIVLLVMVDISDWISRKVSNSRLFHPNWNEYGLPIGKQLQANPPQFRLEEWQCGRISNRTN